MAVKRDKVLRDAEKLVQKGKYEQAIKDAKNLLRYAVARWGYSTAVVGWEYFNEQDPGLRILAKLETQHAGFEIASRVFFDTHLAPGDIFVDVGAHAPEPPLHIAEVVAAPGEEQHVDLIVQSGESERGHHVGCLLPRGESAIRARVVRF